VLLVVTYTTGGCTTPVVTRDYLFKTLTTTSAISWKSNVPVRTNRKYLLFGSRLSNEKSFVKPPVVSKGAFQNLIILATRSKNKIEKKLNLKIV